MVTRSTAFRLRSGSPQPVKGNCDQLGETLSPTTGFVLQTFMAEKRITDTCEDQDELLCSNDMRGLGGNFVSASYNAQKFKDPETGSIVFQESKEFEGQIIDEDEVPGVSNL